MDKIKDFFKTHTKEKLTSIIFLVMIFGLFAGLIINVRTVGSNFITSYRTNVPTGAPYSERLKGAISAAETAANEGTYRKQDFVELYGLAQVMMGKNIVTDYGYGSLYKTSFGQITFAVPERYILDSCTETYRLVNALKEYDIPFLYIQLPFKIPPSEYGGASQLPANVKDHSNENADFFLENLKSSDVAHYDIRDDFWQCGKTQNELFFNTDHHWTIEGALTGTSLIADHLNKNYDMGIPEGLYKEENFKFRKYEDFFLGSMGRRVGRIYGGVDDFTLITPAFPTDITLEQIEGENVITKRGTFEEAVLDRTYLDDPLITANRYAAYHGDNQELRFTNHLAENDSKILIIKDSFGIPVYSFLSMGIREVRAIDMRLFEKNVAEYAKEYDPDLVILMYNADSFVQPMFDFNL